MLVLIGGSAGPGQITWDGDCPNQLFDVGVEPPSELALSLAQQRRNPNPAFPAMLHCNTRFLLAPFAALHLQMRWGLLDASS